MTDISSATTASSNSFPPSSSNGTVNIADLIQQKTELLTKIAEEKASDDTDEIKKQKIAQMEKQVKSVEAEIALEQAKEKKEAEEGKTPINSKQPDPDLSKILDTKA